MQRRPAGCDRLKCTEPIANKTNEAVAFEIRGIVKRQLFLYYEVSVRVVSSASDGNGNGGPLLYFRNSSASILRIKASCEQFSSETSRIRTSGRETMSGQKVSAGA